jgi:hypothetical protein
MRSLLPGVAYTVALVALLVSRTPGMVAARSPTEANAAVRAHVAPWSTALASAYSSASTRSTTQGCPGAPPLRDEARSVATFLVDCGRRMRVCHRRRCVTVTRWDSGPFTPGRAIDLNVGVVRELGFASARAWGVRSVRWRVVPR